MPALTAVIVSFICTASTNAEQPAEGHKGLLPKDTFGVGAQTEFIGPTPGTAGLLVAIDRGPIQMEVTVAAGLFEAAPTGDSQTDAYLAGFRLFFPLHRAARADFSLGAGAALVFLNQQNAGFEPALTFIVGGRARIFVVPNVAIFGTMGAGGVLQRGASVFFVGARPLGSAGFIYYFT